MNDFDDSGAFDDYRADSGDFGDSGADSGAFHDSGTFGDSGAFDDYRADSGADSGALPDSGAFVDFDFEAFEWDQTAMALIGYALSEDAEASASLLGPLSAGDLREIAERLADILARTLLEEAEVAGVDRDEVVASWQSCVLQHAAQRRPY